MTQTWGMPSEEELDAIEYVRDLKAFYQHLDVFCICIFGMFILNLAISPGYLWALWAMFGWGIGVAAHGLAVFDVFSFLGPEWEERRIKAELEKRAASKDL